MGNKIWSVSEGRLECGKEQFFLSSGPKFESRHPKSTLLHCHEIFSLKVPNVEFDFYVPDDILMLGFRH